MVGDYIVLKLTWVTFKNKESRNFQLFDINGCQQKIVHKYTEHPVTGQ